MNKIDYDKGFDNLKNVIGQQNAELVLESLGGVAEDIGKLVLEFAALYDRKALDLKQREMITITSLLSQGDTEPQLAIHIKGSLNVGLTQEEIIETFIQCIPYVGFPKVLNAVFVAKKIFAEFDTNTAEKS